MEVVVVDGSVVVGAVVVGGSVVAGGRVVVESVGSTNVPEEAEPPQAARVRADASRLAKTGFFMQIKLQAGSIRQTSKRSR
ncbi:MAG: hypothetical protein JRE18_07645 [Deltaproteobacteria bacterium]|nr:hypothetical protein [Deltaproteobacteria bacterium]